MAKKKGKKGSGSRSRTGINEQIITRVKFPVRRNGEQFARVTDILGNDRMRVFCEDGKSRIGRIRGKIKKRVWIRLADLVVVNPWEFEDEKCEISWRYTRAEIQWLERNNKIPEILDINNVPL
jgi:translation initiation factor 1A